MINDILMPKHAVEAIPGTRHTGDENHLFRELMRTHSAVVFTYARCMGAPASRIGLMRLLAIAPSQLGTSDLARRLGVDPAAVTRQLKALEAEGLVARGRHRTDGRRTTVKLTRAGLEAFREIHDQGHAYERALAAEVTRKDVDTAVRVLQAMRKVVLRSVNQDEEAVP
jgi:DNA-binding MarR family transcriptional regulator